ncbi:MAG: cupin domain-containing protein [Dehalococcoidia bacterium]|nr:cupin domain-containing protein [Dehalococcoidia bacterium]
MGTRRVVTGHSPAGKAIVASDVIVDPVTTPLSPGRESYMLWGGDVAPHFPDDGSRPPSAMYFPPVGGFRFGLFVIPPDQTPRDLTGVDVEAATAAYEAAMPGLMGYMEPASPGMHTTDTIDYEYVVSGRCILELDDGVTVELHPGDTVVQNGTRHAWRNPFDEPCRMVLALVGAHRASST